MRTMILSEYEYDKVVKIFVAFIALFGIAAIFYFFVTHQRAEPLGIYAVGAGTLLTVAIVHISILKWWKNLFWLIAFFIVLLGFALTFCRMLSLVLLLAPFLWLLIKRGKTGELFFTLFFSTLAITLFMAINHDLLKMQPDFQFFYKKQEITKTEKRLLNTKHMQLSIYGRALSYKDGLDKFRGKPIFGLGLFKHKGLLTYHNFYIEWLAYGGALGFILYSLTFLSHAIRFRKIAVYDSFVQVNLIIIFAVLCNSFMNGIMHGTMPTILFMSMAFNELRRSFLGEERKL
jgi:O-antigen ligase